MLWSFFAFMRRLAGGGKLAGLLLVLATVVSLALRNSAVGEAYGAFWEWPLGYGLLLKPLSHWINDGLMAVFFFAVGLEIRREVQGGELAGPRQALLPALAAVGGVAVPALVYFAFNYGRPTASGWAIPTATDIAFSLGILALLGRRVPGSLRLFLTALAIIDDLLAVVIIALFYAGALSWPYLGAAALLWGLLLLLNRWRVRPLGIYLGLGLLLWFCVLQSGIHATVAGVLLALAIPAGRLAAVEHALHQPVNYLILPLFALCNTAIALSAEVGPQLASPLALGIGLGLLLGKPLGIAGTVALAVRRGWAVLPVGVSWMQLLGLGFTAGIGFTMAIFIATLSFQAPATVAIAKLAVLLGSAAAGLLGAALLVRAGRTAAAQPATARALRPPV